MGLIDEFFSHRRYDRVVRQVDKRESDVRELADEEFSTEYLELRRRRRAGADYDELMPDTFALVREASRRTIGIRPYDCQVRAAAALAEGKVAEMKTGEGKTYVTPMAASLYALDQQGVHVLTANDYLAGRDQEHLAPVYQLLGLTSSCVVADTAPQERREAYQTDITYTTVVQLGFDFLRQYFQQDPEQLRSQDMWQYLRSEIDGSTRAGRCLRGRYCAILDEADSILIDYARRPLSLSMQADIQRPKELYRIVRRFVMANFQRQADFTLNEVERELELTDGGRQKIERLQEEYGHFHLMQGEWEDRIEEALKAEYLFEKGTHYVVREDRVILIDQTSGRLKVGQRLGGELHQALECKEGVSVKPRQQVAKKVTIQSLIRPYDHLAGMTGTAWEARREFQRVYSMKTIRFSPRIPDETVFHPDQIYVQDEPRWQAVIEDIQQEHAAGRPVLVGTRSVDASEQVSAMLEEIGVEHDVLNAVNHAAESEIIAHAGTEGRVTVATNMAGRGVEIPLEDDVLQLGGLHVIGTERHTLSRLDRQLAGRTGRRGQPGSVRFYGALEDDVFQALEESTVERLKRRYGSNENGVIPPRQADKLVDQAQQRFSNHHAQIRQSLLAQDLAQEEGDKILFGQDRL